MSMQRPEFSKSDVRLTPMEAWMGGVVLHTTGQPEAPAASGLKESLILKALSDAVISEVYTPQTAQDRLDELFPDKRLSLAEFQPGFSD